MANVSERGRRKPTTLQPTLQGMGAVVPKGYFVLIDWAVMSFYHCLVYFI
jgi:hypothetical protein